jgi:Tol biopolymer transport system component
MKKIKRIIRSENCAISCFKGSNMRKKTNVKFLATVLCFILGTMLFASQACKRDRSSADQSGSLEISASDSSPSWSLDGNRIVFHSNRDGNWEIYVMNADGSNQTRLTDNPVDDGAPSWSPHDQKIAFASERDGNEEIYTMNADGSNLMRLTDNPAPDETPSWSPDGTRIVFGSNRDGNYEIYTMNTDGSNLTRLTDNPAADEMPSWSHDGQKIAFDSDRDGNYEIYTMNADGSNLMRLTDNPADDGVPSWSPDGQKIAFVSERDGNPEIYAMNADGSNQTRLTNNPTFDEMPSWSPDGQKIAFTSNRDFIAEVYVMDADGVNQVNLTNNAPVDETFGSVPLPRSELNLGEIPYRIVFESLRETNGKENWEICLIDADGSNLINLTNTAEIDEMYPHASPDGGRVCFVADEGEVLESKRRNVYYMNIDGTDRVKIAENAYQPCWSADGRHIAYLPAEYPRYDPRIWANKGLEIYDLKTGEVKRHPNEKLIHLARLCWSPDGKWFVARPPFDIVFWNIDFKNVAFRADDKTLMSLSILGCTPDISPDGKQLVWNGTDRNLNIGVLDFDSPKRSVTSHRVVVACEYPYWVYHADWSLDGNYLTFNYGIWDEADAVGEQEPGTHICICDLRTGKWTQITTDGKHNKEPDWVPVQVR